MGHYEYLDYRLTFSGMRMKHDPSRYHPAQKTTIKDILQGLCDLPSRAQHHDMDDGPVPVEWDETPTLLESPSSYA